MSKERITTSNKFVVESLGTIERDVYDIEVEDTHSFFANGILVHNSAGLDLSYLVDRMFPNDQSDKQKIVDFLDKFEKAYIDPFMAEEFEKLTQFLNFYKNRISMKREVIADKGLWRGKKHYILQVYDKEGIRYQEPKLKMMGIETAKSSTPNIVRGSLEKAIRILLNKDEGTLQNYVSQFKNEFFSATPSEIAFPRGVSDIDKWILGKDGGSRVGGTGNLAHSKGVSELHWKSKCPIHVRASIVHNNQVLKHGLQSTHPLIRNGDKIKFLYLDKKNPTLSNVIGFHDELPTEFGLGDYIDKQLQYEKTFLDPLKTFTHLLDWTPDKVATLSNFFS